MKRFPFHIQHDAMQCGATCLQMVCAWYGKKMAVADIESICPPAVGGVSMLALKRTAEELGLRAMAGLTALRGIEEIPLPCIMHWRQNHFVVLYGIRRKHGRRTFMIADPARGPVTCTESDMEHYWVADTDGKGIVMLLEPTPAFRQTKGTGTNGKRSIRFLLGYMRHYHKYFAQVACGLALGGAIQIMLPSLTQAIVDKGIAHRDIGIVWLILIGQLMLTVSGTSLDFIRRWILLHISVRINISLISDFFAKMFRLPMPFFDTKLTGDILQRMGDHSRIEDFLTGQLLSILFSMITLLALGTMLLCYSSIIFTVFVAFSIVYALWICAFLQRRKVIDYDMFACQSVCNDTTWQIITSMQEIKLQDCSTRRRRDWETARAGLFRVQLESQKLAQAEQAGGIFINSTKNIVITVLAAMAVIDGSITLGMMLAIQYIIGQLSMPVEQLLGFVYSLQDVRISLERINEIHGAEEEKGTDTLTAFAKPERDILISNITFRYEREMPVPVLDNVSINIEQGRTTAIVGTSGSGKTTLLKLLLGYYPAESGKIMVCGAPIEKYNMQWWRSKCGVVMQDGVIFSETIARNIAVDDSEIDTDRLAEAARIAHIGGFIDDLPLKYNTLIGRNGMGLSAGQKQRILIARAVYKNPDFIFLDEATNSLDANNEKAIVEDLEHFFKGRTVLIIAHRLSTVRKADKIVVIDRGRVAESGTHNELTAARGEYYKLVKNQLEL